MQLFSKLECHFSTVTTTQLQSKPVPPQSSGYSTKPLISDHRYYIYVSGIPSSEQANGTSHTQGLISDYIKVSPLFFKFCHRTCSISVLFGTVIG